MVRNGAFQVVLFFCLLCNSIFAFSTDNDTIPVNESTSSLDFHEKVTYYIDDENAYDISFYGDEQLRRKLQTPYTPGYYNGGNLWAGFYLKNDSPETLKFILEVGGYNAIHVFYRKVETSSFKEKVTGRYIPYPKNELGNNHFRNNRVRFELEPNTPYEFVLFYPDPGLDKIKPTFIVSSEEAWQFTHFKKDSKGNILLGLFFGVSIVLALINFIYYFIHKEKAYRQYSAYIITIVYFEASRYGIVDATPIIRHPILYFFLENTFLILTVIYYLLFLKSFIDTKNRYPLWNKMVNILSVVLLVGLAICLWLIAVPQQPLTAIEIRNYFLLLTLPIAIVFLINLAIKGNRIDKIFLLGSIVLIGSGMVSLILDLYFKDNLYPDLIFQIGVIIEITIFSIGLGVKSRSNEVEKLEAQLNLIDQLKENERLQHSLNQELEIQVQERTKEIQAQNEELVTQQEELAAHRDMLAGQNSLIAKSMDELQEIKSKLEEKVENRTQQLKSANHELIQRNNQLEQYAYITAHNLRAPVARMKGLMYIFEKIGGVTKDHEDIIGKISRSTLEMDDVLTDMNAILELKNNTNGQTQPVDIEQIIEKVKKILSDSLRECKARVSIKLDIPQVHANEPYLESIVYNLISNAIKYRSEKRQLVINISTFKDGSNVILEISDNGVGIDLEKFGPKLFGLYQRFHDHVGGKGMGLYLVKTQVEALGGRIDIESQENSGTRFLISLPN